MPRFRFTTRELLTWTAWLAIYLAVRRAAFVRNSFFSIEPYWIEAHLGFVWTAVAIDRFFRPQVRSSKSYLRGMLIGMGVAAILTIESIVSFGRLYHLFSDFASLFNSIGTFTRTLIGGLVSGAVFGLTAVLFYSFLPRRLDEPSSPDLPPRTPPHCPTTGAHHDRAPP